MTHCHQKTHGPKDYPFLCLLGVFNDRHPTKVRLFGNAVVGYCEREMSNFHDVIDVKGRFEDFHKTRSDPFHRTIMKNVKACSRFDAYHRRIMKIIKPNSRFDDFHQPWDEYITLG
jgi:hypothetical protein